MLLYVDETRKVLWYNQRITKEESQPYLSETVQWFDQLPLPHCPLAEEGKQYHLFLTEENTLVYERVPYQPPKEPEPTPFELSMQCLTDLELQNLEAQQERQLLAQQISDLELVILEGGASNV